MAASTLSFCQDVDMGTHHDVWVVQTIKNKYAKQTKNMFFEFSKTVNSGLKIISDDSN